MVSRPRKRSLIATKFTDRFARTCHDLPSKKNGMTKKLSFATCMKTINDDGTEHAQNTRLSYRAAWRLHNGTGIARKRGQDLIPPLLDSSISSSML